jgi:hypothetical protein
MEQDHLDKVREPVEVLETEVEKVWDEKAEIVPVQEQEEIVFALPAEKLFLIIKGYRATALNVQIAGQT